MKALFYAKHYPGYGHVAGAESTAHDLMKTLQVNGWETSALLGKIHNGVSDYTIDGVDVKVPQTSGEVKHLPFQKFPGNDIIITQLSSAARAGILAKQYNIPSLHLVHNDHLHNEQTSRKYTDLSIYNTSWVKDQWSLPGMVLHPIVNPLDYRVEPKREFDITLINLSRGDDVNYNKGFATFYELARRMPERRFLGVKGAYGNQHVEDLPNVTIWEHQRDMRLVYEASSIIIIPSKYESYGRVGVEGFASGLPAVATNLPGVHEALGDAALYCSFGDFDEWELAVRKQLNNYNHYSALAITQSQKTWKRSQQEIDNLLTLCECLTESGLKVAYDFLEVL